MIFRNLVAALSCAALCACAIVPPTEQNDGISIKRVVERVKCELGAALQDNGSLESWAGVITLTLEVDQTGSVVPSASLAGPFNAGAYGLDIGGGVTGKSVQTSLVNVYFPVYELLAFANACPIAPKNQLEDSLGLREWVDRTLSLKADEGAVFKDKDKAIGYTLEFDLDLTAGITPGFTFTRVSSKTGFSVDRKTVNTLEIALADAGIQPPRRVPEIVRVPVKPTPGTMKPAQEGAATDDTKKQEGQKFRYEKRYVVRHGAGVSDDTKKRLDVIIQQLQLKNLRIRGF
jgi:hypothetical protein